MFGLPAQGFIEVTDIDGAKALKAKLVEEAGRHLPPERARRMGVPGRPSLLQDLLKGRRTEIDYLNGYVVQKGQEVGVSTQLNQIIVELVKKVERGELKPNPLNLKELERHLAV